MRTVPAQYTSLPGETVLFDDKGHLFGCLNSQLSQQSRYRNMYKKHDGLQTYS